MLCKVSGLRVTDETRGSRLLRGILDICLLALVAGRDQYGYELPLVWSLVAAGALAQATVT